METGHIFAERLEKSPFIQDMVRMFLDKVEKIAPSLVLEESSEKAFQKLVFMIQEEIGTSHDIQSKKVSRKAWLKEIETNALTGEASELFAEGCREFHDNLEMKNPFEKQGKL
ncbi:hypothetical protein PN36_23275 [Candidatus Thiomargarita nelsonii]|uniref:Uncharacterized protein n=1 Tax=Candidatus Thiomargarita nelsonii TaxID=1003181 RepID=A0A4E0QNH5_9GAMM|nr:hypothetical protein PN36_23275 [Candidatus Thiomargarita nelsonii]